MQHFFAWLVISSVTFPYLTPIVSETSKIYFIKVLGDVYQVGKTTPSVSEIHVPALGDLGDHCLKCGRSVTAGKAHVNPVATRLCFPQELLYTLLPRDLVLEQAAHLC